MVEEEAKEDSKPKPKAIKKPNWKRIGVLIAIIVVIALVVFFIWKFTGGKDTVQEMVDINYNVQLEDNTIIDSGSDKFASGSVASFFNFATNKLDQEIAVMVLNEEKTITLEPKDAYGEYDENFVFSYNKTLVKDERSQEMNRTVTRSIDEFKQFFNEVPLADKTYETSAFVFPLKVLEVREEANEVDLSYEAKIGDEIFSGMFDLDFKVTSITSDKIILKLQGENKVYTAAEIGSDIDLEIIFTSDEFEILLKPEIGQWIELPEKPRAKVTSIDDTYIHLDPNSEYAGKKIIITITLNKRYKEEAGITGFVTCLDKTDFKIYGANWCSWTKKLVDEFGGFDVVKPIYVECTEQTALCNEKGITGYPTILIKDQAYVGERTFEEFAKATGCKAPTTLTKQSDSSNGGSC